MLDFLEDLILLIVGVTLRINLTIIQSKAEICGECILSSGSGLTKNNFSSIIVKQFTDLYHIFIKNDVNQSRSRNPELLHGRLLSRRALQRDLTLGIRAGHNSDPGGRGSARPK